MDQSDVASDTRLATDVRPSRSDMRLSRSDVRLSLSDVRLSLSEARLSLSEARLSLSEALLLARFSPALLPSPSSTDISGWTMVGMRTFS